MELFGHVMLEDDLDRRAARLLGRPRARARGPGPRRHARRGRARSLRDGPRRRAGALSRAAATARRAALYTRRRDRHARRRAAARRGARDARRPHRRRRRREACRAALRAAAPRDVAARRSRRPRLLPGFIDTHLHPIALLYFDLNADLRGVRSIAALQRRAARRGGARCPRASGWSASSSRTRISPSGASRRAPSSTPPAGERPVVVLEHDGHSAVGNSRALAAAGITAHAGR